MLPRVLSSIDVLRGGARCLSTAMTSGSRTDPVAGLLDTGFIALDHTLIGHEVQKCLCLDGAAAIHP